MINDLQEIYLTWVKDRDNNWLKVLFRSIEINIMNIKQQKELEFYRTIQCKIELFNIFETPENNSKCSEGINAIIWH